MIKSACSSLMQDHKARILHTAHFPATSSSDTARQPCACPVDCFLSSAFCLEHLPHGPHFTSAQVNWWEGGGTRYIMRENNPQTQSHCCYKFINADSALKRPANMMQCGSQRWSKDPQRHTHRVPSRPHLHPKHTEKLLHEDIIVIKVNDNNIHPN